MPTALIETASALLGQEQSSGSRRAVLKYLRGCGKKHYAGTALALAIRAGMASELPALSDLMLKGADFSGCKLCNLHLPGASMLHVDLRNADLRSANLCGANLQGAEVQGCDWWRVDLREAHMDEDQRRHCRATGAILE